MKIQSHTEWDSLHTIMVADIDTDHPDIVSDVFKLKGKHLKNLVVRTKQMLDTVSEQLDKMNIEVIRPDPTKYVGPNRFPMLNIRDRFGVIGDTFIQYSTNNLYKNISECVPLDIDIVFERYEDGQIWYNEKIKNEVPYLEGANLIRCGSKIFTTIKHTGNQLGIDYLQSVIGDQYEIIPVTTVINHLDAHINFVNSELMLYDARMDISEIQPHIPNVKTVPILYERIADKPELVWPDIQDDDIENTNLLMSNTITIDPETVLCLNAKYDDIEFFHNNNIQCITIDWPEQWLVNAGLHCFTVDIEREGTFGNPFDKT